MKKLYSPFCLRTAFVLLFMLTFVRGWGQIIISQVYEGASNNKWVEVTNVGGTSIDLASPIQYKLAYWNTSGSTGNGSIIGNPTNSINLIGTLAPGQSYLMNNTGSSTSVPHNPMPSANNSNTTVAGFNGNDAIALITGTNTIVDAFGVGINNTDISYHRNASVLAPNSTFTTSEWTSRTLAQVALATSTMTEYISVHLFGAATYAVSYNGNTNTSGTAPTDATNYASGSTVTVFGNTGSLAKTGYSFADWNTVANGTGTVRLAGSTFSITSNTTLYAQWTPNNNTITFDKNHVDANGTTATQTLATAATANLTANGYTRAGYVFSGWATTPTGAVAYANGASYTMGTANVTLYAVWTVPTPEINIKQAATNIATNGTHAFGNHVSGTSSAVVTFTIENTGTADLLLNGNPNKIAISGTNASEFIVNQTSTASPVGAGSSTTFTVTFSPITQGSKIAQLTIANNDADEGSYIINLSGTGTVSTASDIVIKSPYTYNQNIDYKNYQGANIDITNSIEIAQFTIRDGGATADADNLGTTLTRLDFNLTNGANIRRVAIYDGATEIAEQAGSTTHSFTGLTLLAPDGGTKDFSVRVSFKDVVTDNQQIGITITASTTAATTGSTFANTSAGGAVTSNASNNNRIEVIADRLAFVQQPSNTGNGATMTPAVTIRAIDVNSNIDLDFTSNVSVNCSTPSALTGNPVSVAAVAGLATYSSLVHTTNGTYTMIGSSTGLTSTAASSNYIISTILYTSGDYRTNPNVPAGNTISFASTNTISGIRPWQRYDGSAWQDVTGSTATSSPSNLSTKPENIFLNYDYVDLAGGGTYNNVIIEGGYVYTASSNGLTIAAGKKLEIHADGYLEVATTGKFELLSNSNLIIKKDGAIDVYSPSNLFLRSSTSNFNVENGGAVYVNNYLQNLWTGNENFADESYFGVYGWNKDAKLFVNAADITTNPATNAKFGYLYFDLQGTSSLVGSGGWTSVFPVSDFKLTSRDFEILSQEDDNINLDYGNIIIGQDFIIDGNGTGIVQAQTTNSSIRSLTVNRDLLKKGSIEYRQISVNGTSTLKIDRNLTITEGIFKMSNATGNISNVNLYGDLEVLSAGSLVGFSTTNNNFNFAGTGNGSSAEQTQTINVVNATTASSIAFNVNSGAYVKLINQNFALGGASSFNVKTLGTLDFGFDGVNGSGTNALNITNHVNSAVFKTEANSTLKITSPAGVTSTVNLGNVQTTSTTRNYDSATNYHYIGKANQSTGNGLPDGLTNKLIVDLQTDATNENLNFTANGLIKFNLSGTLEIKRGRVIDAPSNGFRNNVVENEDGESDLQKGNLVMTGGRYVVSGSGIKPSLSGNYTLASGTVEFTGVANTKIRTSSSPVKQYENVDVSGTNVETGGKNFIVNNLLKVTDATAVLTVPEVLLESETPFVVTAKKGIQIVNGGKAIFKNNANLLQDIDATNVGNITMERKATVPSIQYNYWASPVENQSLYGLYAVPANSVKTYNSTSDLFNTLPNGSTSVFGKGYSIKGPTTATVASPTITATFVGKPNNESTAGVNTIALSTEGRNFNLIGNPYPSNLDLVELYNANVDQFYNVDSTTPTVFLWDNTGNTELTQLGTSYSGYAINNYATVNLPSGLGAPATRNATTGKIPNGIVRPGQGFIMRASETATNLVFKNNQRTSAILKGGKNSQYFKGAATASNDNFWLRLTTSRNMNIVIALSYHPEATNSFERFDSSVLNEAVTENFYSLSSDSKKLAIQSRKGDFNTEDVIPLAIKISENGIQKISIEDKTGVFSESQNIYLRDKALNKVINLSTGDYTFSANKGTDDTRFEIVYKDNLVLGTDVLKKSDFVVYKDGLGYVINSTKSLGKIEVYDAAGRLVLSQKTTNKNIKLDATTLANGLYIIKTENSGDVKTNKILK